MLPFIAGIAAGAVAVVAYNNNKKIRKNVNEGAKKAKHLAQEGYEKTKEFAKDVKASVDEKVESLKSKKEEKKIEKEGETANGNE
ncbi:YtxH domain-containing protein [Halarcobacter anaerophilus]|uniref:YtxH domain-containing protein n=1 Tax=Halarcobacter anaerophilus TaxID=877500 RepID=A0A4Q0XXT5_9BACT|nr:YtxH domain-containing protein [Halarcobacter anaerophilus]QDF28278.1 hypothetical protein AANAER_0785 [Halarcobacter anaerophilus]RXJ62053.1 hypothetical protein CRV06_11520 [Halarcobacter anaerophilus]